MPQRPYPISAGGAAVPVLAPDTGKTRKAMVMPDTGKTGKAMVAGRDLAAGRAGVQARRWKETGMRSITVYGGSGYAGSAIVREAAARGHRVTVVTRSAPAERVAGVQYVQTEPGAALPGLDGADVIVGALSPRNGSEGMLPGIYRELSDAAVRSGSRMIVVGGFGSLRMQEGEPRLAEGDALPEWLRPEAREMLEALVGLQSTPDELDWLFVSPAQEFGARREQGPARGAYRLGADVALFDEDGRSVLEGADFALAILDEIEQPAHRRAHISVVS